MPHECWDEKHLPRLEDAMLTPGLGELWKRLEIRAVTVYSALNSLPVRPQGIRIQAVKINPEQSHLLPVIKMLS